MGEDLVIDPSEQIGQSVASWSPESFDAQRIEGFVEDLTPDEEIRQGRRFGLHVIEGNEPASDIGRFVESQVFDEFFQNDLERMKQEYSPYDAESTFLSVLDYEEKKPVGVIRIIRPSEAGLKSLNDLVDPSGPWFKEGDTVEKRFSEIGSDPEHTVDISTMAIMPEYRTNHAADGASAALYSSCVRWSLAHGYNRWVTIVDESIYDMMQSWGEPFQPFKDAEWASYIDSAKSIPVHTELHSGLEKIKRFDQDMTQKFGNPVDIHGLYTRGVGLEKDFVLPDFGDAVQ
ncbi:MAG TPA: GNAT family N-acyltransferase [Candidatus Saccharimonadales bacterium]|nr:GNAT family N-acyltransferase [Candidatus Saccharimonadales bacterium]